MNVERHRNGWDSALTIYNSISIMVNERGTGFTVREAAEYTHGFSERTVRDFVDFLRIHDFVEKRSDGRYYLTRGLAETGFQK